MSLFGRGWVRLGSEKLDITFDPYPKKINLAAAVPPVKIGGVLSAPEYGIDSGAAATWLVELVESNRKVPQGRGLYSCKKLLTAKARKRSKPTKSATETISEEASSAKKEVKKAWDMLKGGFR